MKRSAEPPADNAFYSLLLAKDQKAWAHVTVFVASIVRKFVGTQRLAEGDDMEEQTQAIMTHLQKKVGQSRFLPRNGKHVQNMESYIRRIAGNRLIEWVRSPEFKERGITDPADPVGPGAPMPLPSPNPPADEQVRVHILQNKFKKIIRGELQACIKSPSRRRAYELYMRLEMGDPGITTFDDIANELDISVAAAKAQVSRAQADLSKSKRLKALLL